MRWILRFFGVDRGDADHVSAAWIRQYEKQGTRIEYHGPRWNFAYLIRRMKAKERRKSFRRVA